MSTAKTPRPPRKAKEILRFLRYLIPGCAWPMPFGCGLNILAGEYPIRQFFQNSLLKDVTRKRPFLASWRLGGEIGVVLP
jgi:hypothetical protein